MSKFADDHAKADLLARALSEYPENAARYAAWFILSGEPLTPPLRRVFEEMSKPAKPGRRKQSWRSDIAFDVQRRRDGGASYEKAIEEAEEKFNVKRTTVTNAYTTFKQIRDKLAGVLEQVRVIRITAGSEQ